MDTRFSFNSSALTDVLGGGPSISLGHHSRVPSHTSTEALDSLIAQVTDPTYIDINLSLVLEICDKINKQGKSAPRQVAFLILKYVNRSSQQSGLHALTLLDYCVKNCGYPFHLIISTKDFLNELVKRFPETPVRLNAIHHKILELIQQWHATLCVSSRYKHDFKHIGDMYRLLIYKGYRFPEVSQEALAALAPIQTLKTADEQEAEDMAAYGVKLEELLRIGTPAALAQANDLMKVMSGYEKRIDYRKEFDEELDRIQQKAIILNDMLNHKKPEERKLRDSTLSDLLSGVKSAQTKIQKLISEEQENDKMDRLLAMNDIINSVVTKYQCYEKGEPVTPSVIDVKRTESKDPPASGESSPSKVGPISLIDFDDERVPAVPTKNPDLLGMDDLLGLESTTAPLSAPTNPLLNLGVFTSQAPPSRFPISMKGGDGSPSTTKISSTPKTESLPANLLDDLDFLSISPNPAVKSVEKVSNSQAIIFDKNGLQIKAELAIKGTEASITVTLMNVTPVQLTDVSYQVSVPKSMTLKMEPAIGTTLAPFNQSPLLQNYIIVNTSKETIKWRFKISYNMNGAIVSEVGEYTHSA